MKKMISCDWGTSSLRLRLVDMDQMTVLGEVLSGQGIAAAFQAWKSASLPAGDRAPFYLTIIKGLLPGLTNDSLEGTPVIISGMASANIGMLELPYKDIPFHTDGSDLCCRTLPATESFQHQVWLISGGKTTSDVMRGEETQLVGCYPASGSGLAEGPGPAEGNGFSTGPGAAGGGPDAADGSPGAADDERLFILPGTHSKHIRVRGKSAVGFKTYMTGEFFSLLSKHSILSGSILEGDTFQGPPFEEGVREGARSNLLHGAFLVRTNTLMGKYSTAENSYFLSGLLIGAELKDLVGQETPLTLVSNQAQKSYYLAAFRTLGIFNVQFVDAADAVIKGQSKIYTYHET